MCQLPHIIYLMFAKYTKLLVRTPHALFNLFLSLLAQFLTMRGKYITGLLSRGTKNSITCPFFKFPENIFNKQLLLWLCVCCVCAVVTRASRSPKFSRGGCFLQGSSRVKHSVLGFQDTMQTLTKNNVIVYF